MAACILASRKLAQHDGGKKVPATVRDIDDTMGDESNLVFKRFVERV
jgi:hypothetical protein